MREKLGRIWQKFEFVYFLWTVKSFGLFSKKRKNKQTKKTQIDSSIKYNLDAATATVQFKVKKQQSCDWADFVCFW